MITYPILYTAVLKCHPETSGSAVHGIEACISRLENGEFALSYTLKGRIDRLKIPTPRPGRRAERLWEHTCFEAFVSGINGPAYCEFNFAPSAEWAVYAFRRYRDGAALLLNEEPAPKITVRGTEDRLELDAAVHLDHLSLIKPNAPRRLALSAVIEDKDGRLSYWALKHPPGKPDFHHPDSFALALEPADLKQGQAGPRRGGIRGR